jgi:penicillin-insensitive murein endopeptidase
MPDHRLSEKEREDLSATSMLAEDGISVNPQVWTEANVRLLKRAASYPQVERVLVHPAIKKAVCEATKADKGADRAWLSKVRPYWGHYYHFHIRIACPKGSGACEHQPAVSGDDGCGAELKRWLKLVKPAPPVATSAKPAPPAPERRPITLDQLPSECRAILASGTPTAGTPSAPAAGSPSAPNKAANEAAADKTEAKTAPAPVPAAKQAAAKTASPPPAAKPPAPAAVKSTTPAVKQTKPAPAKAAPLYE